MQEEFNSNLNSSYTVFKSLLHCKYLPISILPVLSKYLERHVSDFLKTYLEKKILSLITLNLDSDKIILGGQCLQQ